MKRERPWLGTAAALGLGLGVLIGASLLGWNEGLVDLLVRPPAIVRAALVGGSVTLAVVLLSRSVGRLAEAGTEDVPGLVRGVRLAFLAVAALAAAAGWVLAHPLPLIVAAVIGAIDVIETSFLLLIVDARQPRQR